LPGSWPIETGTGTMTVLPELGGAKFTGTSATVRSPVHVRVSRVNSNGSGLSDKMAPDLAKGFFVVARELRGDVDMSEASENHQN